MTDSNNLLNIALEDDDSDDEFSLFVTVAIHELHLTSQRQTSRRHCSVLGHAIIINRGRVEGHERFYRDYFAEHPVYSPQLFRRRFQMDRPLFIRIQSAVKSYDPYFLHKRDACGILGLSSLQKITTALRMLVYGTSADSVDDYVRIGESTAIKSLKRFVKEIVGVFGDEYLRSPNDNDIARLLAFDEQRGFPEMLESIDCIHWK